MRSSRLSPSRFRSPFAQTTLLAAATLLALCAAGSEAATLSVTVHDQAGAAAQDAVVVLDPLDATPPPTHGKAVIDQIDKQYVPRVSVVRTGTGIAFPNSDHIRHQVYSFSPAKTFNLKLYAGSPPTEVVFDKPGLVVLGCNIHDSMVAFVGVVDSPYFAKTPRTGSVDLDLPPGRYRLRVWHPNLAGPAVAREITVSAAPLTVPLTLELDPAHDGTAAWSN